MALPRCWFEAIINMLVDCTKIMKMLSIDEQTYRRLASIMNELMHTEKRNINYDDVINELIDVYQDRLALSGENAGG
jgi:K+/H+ antiporter YhaU regulatory subunit KhtT